MSSIKNKAEMSTQIDPGRQTIVLLDRLGMQRQFGVQECDRNIFLITADGQTVWRVTSDFDDDGGPFTNVMFDDGRLTAYRWDGGLYEIDLIDGHASPLSLSK